MMDGMRKLFLLGAISMMNAFAVKVTFPAKNLLEQRLKENGFDDFLRVTKIADALDNKEIEAAFVGLTARQALAIYSSHRKRPQEIALLLKRRESDLINILLDGNESAIAEANAFIVQITSKNK